MSRLTLAELKARHKDQQQKNQNKGSQFSNNRYQFWKIADQEESEMRILPDADEDNLEVFQIEKKMHKLHVNGKQRLIPCLTMYNEECPICERSRKYYDAGDKKNGKYYWRQRSVLIRGLVIKDPLPVEAEGPRIGKVMEFEFTKQLGDRVLGGLADFSDDDAAPWDLDAGCNFIIRKSVKHTPEGQQADYMASGFARRSSPIPAEFRENLKLVPLHTLLPQNPGIDKVVALLEAHDNGNEYVEGNENATSTPATSVVTDAPLQGDESIPFEPKPETVVTPAAVVENKPVTAPVTQQPAASDTGEEDILAKIRNRNKPKASA